jgi:hypothetical protein
MKLFSFLLIFFTLLSAVATAQDATSVEIIGLVLDQYSQKPISQASIEVIGVRSKRSISNDEGRFSIQLIPNEKETELVVNALGYQSATYRVDLAAAKNLQINLVLEPREIKLDEVQLDGYKNPQDLVERMLQQLESATSSQSRQAIGFFRERIQKREKNLSLAEAVVGIVKRPNSSTLTDQVFISQSRKRNSYRSVDSIAVKLQGGPYNLLYNDISRYPEIIFTPKFLDYYSYKFLGTTEKFDRELLMVYFEPRNTTSDPAFSGELYIDKQSFNLVSANFRLGVNDREKSAKIFVKKKPTGTDIWPTKANYQIDYAPDGDLWQLQYGKIELEFRVNWKARLFRRNYQIDAEMMITDWIDSKQNSLIREDQRLKPNAIMSESTLGFTDTDFWGEYTIIEPDSSIEKILDKIKRQLERLKEE